MTIATANNADKNEITARFRSDITNVVNALPGKWHTGSWPSTSPVGGALSSATPGVLGDNLLPGTVITSSPADSEIPYGAAELSTVVLRLRTAASILSRCRYVRMLKYYNTNGVNGATYDVTNLAHMSATWERAPGTFSSLSGTDLNAAGVLTFIATLQAEVTAHRNSTVTFTEFWCHSSCHSNHSSRNRR